MRKLRGPGIWYAGNPVPPAPNYPTQPGLPTLTALTLSATVFSAGVPASGPILGASPGSVIIAFGLTTGLTINSLARTWIWDGSGSIINTNLTLTETLSTELRTSIIPYAVIGGVPAPSGVARFLNSGDGSGTIVSAPIVGQPLYIDPGPFTGAPTSYDYQVYAGGVALDDATGTWIAGTPAPVYIPVDTIAGSTLVVKCHGINPTGPSVTTSNSAATTAVAAIDLTNAITAFTRTSSSGTTPMTWSLTFGSNVYEGYYLHARVYSDSGLSVQTQDVVHFLTHADLQSGATIDLTSDGLVAPGATDWLQLTVETTSPNGNYHSFLYPTPLTPTDAVAAMTWSTTDKTAGMTVSGGNLTASCSGGPDGLRSNRAVNYDLTYWELTVTGAIEDIAVADSSAPLGTVWGGGGSDGTATIHAGSYLLGPAQIAYNGSLTATAAYATGVTWGVALDRINKKVWFAKNNAWQNGTPGVSGGTAMASIGTPIYPAAQFNNGATATAIFGTTPGGTAGFTYTPPTGFVAP